MLLEEYQHVSLPPKTVAITFDDGPGPLTEPIAEYLFSQGIAATFFMVGRQLLERPQTARRVLRLGHDLANHTQSHRNLLRFTSSGELIDEVLATTRALRAITDAPVQLRSPFGQWSPAIARVLNTHVELRSCIGPVGWTINEGDYLIGRPLAPSAGAPIYTFEECCERYLQSILAQKSGIVLFHDWSADAGELGYTIRRNNRTLELLQWLVPRLAGFRFITTSQIDRPQSFRNESLSFAGERARFITI